MKPIIASITLWLVSPALAQTAIPSEAYTHPQRLVVVDGTRRLNVFCEGQGTPMVLFDSGLGDTMTSWSYVQGEVAKTTRACSYDRAGYGFSDPPPGASDVTAAVDDIHRLLKAMKTDGPIVYVGHSIAGLYGVVLQGRYPDTVAAEVLVDPSFADQAERTADPSSPVPKDADQGSPPWAPMQACLDLAKAGKLRMPKTKAAKACVVEDTSLDPILRRVDALQQADPVAIRTRISEISSFFTRPGRKSVDEIEVDAAHAQFGDKPLIILTHGGMPPMPGQSPVEARRFEDAWMAGHDRLAALSTRGSNTVVPGSQHYIQLDQPKAVIDAVGRAVAAVRGVP